MKSRRSRVACDPQGPAHPRPLCPSHGGVLGEVAIIRQADPGDCPSFFGSVDS